MENKVDVEEHSDVKELIQQLPKVEDVRQLKHYVVSNIETFHADNETFHEDFRTHNEIIRRYDEVLAQKVSVIAMEQESNKMNELIETKLADVEEVVDKINEEIATSNKQFSAFEETTKTDIDEKIAAQIKIERRKGAQNAQKNSALNAAIHSEGIGQLKTMM